jgi:hypothetical protein
MARKRVDAGQYDQGIIYVVGAVNDPTCALNGWVNRRTESPTTEIVQGDSPRGICAGSKLAISFWHTYRRESGLSKNLVACVLVTDSVGGTVLKVIGKPKNGIADLRRNYYFQHPRRTELDSCPNLLESDLAPRCVAVVVIDPGNPFLPNWAEGMNRVKNELLQCEIVGGGSPPCRWCVERLYLLQHLTRVAANLARTSISHEQSPARRRPRPKFAIQVLKIESGSEKHGPCRYMRLDFRSTDETGLGPCTMPFLMTLSKWRKTTTYLWLRGELRC